VIEKAPVPPEDSLRRGTANSFFNQRSGVAYQSLKRAKCSISSYPEVLSSLMQTIAANAHSTLCTSLTSSLSQPSASCSSSITMSRQSCKWQSNLLVCPCDPAVAVAADIRELLGPPQGQTNLGLAENVAKGDQLRSEEQLVTRALSCPPAAAAEGEEGVHVDQPKLLAQKARHESVLHTIACPQVWCAHSELQTRTSIAHMRNLFQGW